MEWKPFENLKEQLFMASNTDPGLDSQEASSSPSIKHLRFIVEAELISRFYKLTERGFTLHIKTGLTIRELLCQHLGISKDYVDERIQTIFLDGKAVDDVDNAWVENGSILALSAAMPGLVGITFRKGGFYASLRDTISYSKSEASVDKGTGKIILKLFNMVAKELAPAFLENGIMIDGNAFHNFVIRNPDDLKAGSITVHLNDEKVEVTGLSEMNWENQQVFLQVKSEKS